MTGDAPVTAGIRRLDNGSDLDLPRYQSADSAGLDIAAAVTDPVALDPGRRALIPTGFAIALPPGYEAQIRPRSGLAAKHGISVLNSPGTVDADYRGEIKVILINLGEARFVVERGMRIAQMIIAPVTRIDWAATDELTATPRGSGGFGSTGTSG